jgi:hypothetical protein
MPQQREKVLITGASSGIGEALAGIFAEYDYDLVLVARSADKLDAMAASLTAEHGVQVRACPMDLALPGSADKLCKALRRQKLSVDILVNNAGVLEHGAFIDTAPVDHQRMIQLNVAGFTDMLAHFLPPMLERGRGRVLNVASASAFMPIPSLATYAATKAYVLSLSEALMEELRDTGVSITALCPGFTHTAMVAKAQAQSGKLRNMPELLIGDVEQVALQGFHACIKGEPIVVPGTVNQVAALVSRATPKWLVRQVSGLLGRMTIDDQS